MSGLEVIGGISAIISILDASKKLYDSVQRDANLPKTFQTIGSRLPVIRHTLETCETTLKLKVNSLPENVCDELDDLVYACQAKAKDLEEIFEKVIPGPSDTLRKRYSTALRRLGKGKEVEQLMKAITEDVQVVVNHHAVMSADQHQNTELDGIIKELESLPPSSQVVNNGTGTQINYQNTGGGKMPIHTGSGNMYIADTLTMVSVKQEDFRFHGPVGVCLRKASSIAPELFVGRGHELREMTEYLKSTPHQSYLVLGGMGGVGKTQLAMTYALSNSDSYSSVFWLNAASEVTLKGSFGEIAGNIFKLQDLNQLSNSKEMIQRVHHWLSDTKNTQWLMIFDNYDDDDDGQFDLSDYCPLASHGAVIITTRRPDLVTRSKYTLDIKPFQSIQESLAILQNLSERSRVQSDPFATRLAERLGGLPLALATAGKYLQRSTFSFEKYLQEYERRWNLNPKAPTKTQDHCERTLYTTWDLSFAHLKSEDVEAAQMLKLLAYFHNVGLWYKLFQDGLTDKSPEWLHDVVGDDVSFERVMMSLADRYFLEVDLESRTWSMHSCVHDWTLAGLNPDIDFQYYWFAFGCVDATIRGVDMAFYGHTTYSRSAIHATRLVSVQKFFIKDKMKYGYTQSQLQQVSRVANLLREHIQLSAAEHMYNQARAGCVATLGQDHIFTLDTLNNFGLLFIAQGKLDQAEEMYLQARFGYEKSLALEHPSALNTLVNLGALYHVQGKLNESEKTYLQAQKSCQKALGPSNILASDIVNNLGNVYRTQGRLNEAEQMYKQAIAGYEKALRPNHTSCFSNVKALESPKMNKIPIFRVMNNLGGLYHDTGKLNEAERMFRLAQAGYEGALGQDHILTLDSFKNLGSVYLDQGRRDEAEQMWRRAFTGYEEVLGPTHISTLDAKGNLGLLYDNQGKADEAERAYKEALSGYEKHFGPKTYHTAALSIANNLGSLYLSRGNLHEAESCYSYALTGRETVLGLSNILTLDTVNNIGNLYRAQRKLEQSEEMYKKALAGYETALAPNKNHKSIFRTVHNLGVLYRDQGKLEKAEEMYKKAAAGLEQEMGTEYTLTLEAIKSLGDLHFCQRNWAEAEPLYLKARTGYEKAFGQDDAQTLKIIRNLGSVYIGQQRLKDAEHMYVRVLAGYEKLWGADNIATFEIANHLGVLYEAQNQLDDAEKMYTRVLAGYEKKQPPNHPLILSIAKILRNLYQRQGKTNEAEQMKTRVIEG